MVVIGYGECEDRTRSRHMAAVRLRNSLLAGCCGITDPDGMISLTPKGRPVIDSDGVDISVSHSLCAVMAGICFDRGTRFRTPDGSDDPLVRQFEMDAVRIGVDVEEIGTPDRHDRYKKIAERYFLPREREYLKKIKDVKIFTDEFFRIWTVKESVCKMTGDGLAGLTSADSFSGGGKRFIHSEKLFFGGKAYYASVCAE